MSNRLPPSKEVANDLSLLRIAVIIPCYNEGVAIGKVVEDLRAALPDADVFVYDNNSTDDTAAEAAASGAIVRHEPRQGKGSVVRRMFADIEADVYVMIDGDDTYDAESAAGMVAKLVDEGLDMVSGSRIEVAALAYRRGHRFGNRMLSGIVRAVFGREFSDVLSGYRVFSRRFVKSFPVMSAGFEIESELTIHALELRMPTAEQPAPYKDRAEGSVSKLRTFSDGFRIIWMISWLLKQERPMLAFSAIGAAMMVTSLGLAYPLVTTFLETGQVPRLPTAVLATGLMLLGFLSIFCGLVLDTVTRGRQEAKRMHYLSIPSVHATLRDRTAHSAGLPQESAGSAIPGTQT